MSNRKAERTLHRIADSLDDELWELVGEWAYYYRRQDDEYGNELIAKLGEHGIDPIPMVKLNHDQVVSWGIKAIQETDLSAASAAFVTGIAIDDWERVRWLIPLRAISNTACLPRHSFGDKEGNCPACGQRSHSEWDPLQAAKSLTYGDCGEDWQVLENVMMVRWFNSIDPPVPQRSDLKLFDGVVKFIADADDEITAYKLAKLTRRQFGGVEETWRVFFETLGFAGVLKTDKQPGHLQVWTDLKDRARPRASGDARSPVCYWKRGLGFDEAVFKELFPDCKLPRRLRAPKDV